MKIKNMLKGLKNPLTDIYLFTKIEKYVDASPVLFSLIILYQGLLSGNSLKTNPPSRLKPAFENPFFRLISLLLISYSATKDIETALITVLIFCTLMYLIRTPEERKKLGYGGFI